MSIFRELSAIPRKSKDEHRVVEWLKRKAETAGFAVEADEARNVVIRVPGSHCAPNAPVIALQGHTDMVCEKTSESGHDFSRDPIELAEDGDWLTADGTTLGADNGIAVAMALNVALDADTPHPPLELVFTSDEEQGMTGAKALQPESVEAKILVNLDSEDEGVFTVGCAGGLGCVIRIPQELDEVTTGSDAYEIEIAGLTGGHSGVDINRPLANANVLLARVLSQILSGRDLRLAEISGGSARNAIPRNARAVVVGDPGQLPESIVDDFRQEFPEERGLSVSVRIVDTPSTAFSVAESRRLVWFISSLPNGVQRMSQEIEGLVETSCNLATVGFSEGALTIAVSCRSSMPSALNHLRDRVLSVSHLFGAEMNVENEYPAWKPDMDSPLLSRCVEMYTGLFGREPEVEVIHAGLECGVIGERIPGIDMISFGPTIKGAHSPDERLHLPSVEKVSLLLAALLKSYC